MRPVVTPDGGLGLCVDPTNCYVSKHPLPAVLNREDFNRNWKGCHCIYHFGDLWYEIKVDALDDRNVSEYRFIAGGEQYILRDYVLNRAEKPLSPELAYLSDNAAVVLYQDTLGKQNAAPAPLCYPVVGSDDIGQQLLPPYERHQLIRKFIQKYLQNPQFGATSIRLASRPAQIQKQVFQVPDLQFGHSKVLSVRRTPDAQHMGLEELGKARLELLCDNTAGFYIKDPLDRQYLLMPRSVYDSFGSRFLADLTAQVDVLFPQPGGYRPKVIPYEDRGKKTFVHQAHAIQQAAESANLKPGYGIVMIHHTTDRSPGDEDQLAAMVVRELRDKYQLHVSVIHSELGKNAYTEVRQADGQRCYRPRDQHRRKLAGYLRNVALNHVLLTNQRWPFVLATPLHADVIIGIDVKNNTCGLLTVGRNGADIRSHLKVSRQKERLLSEQLKAYLLDVLRKEAAARQNPIQTVVIHRDGRVWPSELEGTRKVLEILKREGTLAPDVTFTILEISKSSPAPLRLFDVRYNKEGSAWVENPQVGAFYLVNEAEGYLCSTGRPFLRQGTANPLHIKLVEGPLPLIKCLEDLYALTTLAWTQPGDCTRYPITIKLNDRILSSEAGEYDADALEFADLSAEEVA